MNGVILILLSQLTVTLHIYDIFVDVSNTVTFAEPLRRALITALLLLVLLICTTLELDDDHITDETLCRVNVFVCPTDSKQLLLESLTAAASCSFTVKLQEADTPLAAVAVILAEPCFRALTRPLELTVNTDVFELCQVTFCDADDGFTVADIVNVSPTCNVFELYDNLTLYISLLLLLLYSSSPYDTDAP